MCNHITSMAIDAEREQAVKEAIDSIAYRVGFFRDYDEPNECFLARLDFFLSQALIPKMERE